MCTLNKNSAITQGVLFVLFFLACTICSKPVYAVANSLPSTDASTVLNNYTATIATVTGADHNGGADGQGNILNDATITLAGSTFITINNGGTLVAKSITFPVGTDASISLQGTSATILPNDTTPIYVTDVDNDGYASDFSTMATTSGTGRRRLLNMATTSETDCLDTGTNSGYVYTSTTCYVDADHDTHGSATPRYCIGRTDHAAVTCSTATHAYYAAGGVVAANPTYLVTNANDCDDTDVAIYPGQPCNKGVDCTACAATGRTCTAAVAAGDNDLPACTTCNGSSTSPVNYTNNTEDTTGSTAAMKCIATCKRCVTGACGLQTAAQDLFDDCTATGTVVRLHESASDSCTNVCASYTHTEALCSGDSAACATHAGSCLDVGTDASGTNNLAVFWQASTSECLNASVLGCNTHVSGVYHQVCSGHTTTWTRCRCN